MADRKKKRAYLDDFEKDLNGNYQYRGAHYHYKGTNPRPGTGRLWVLCGGGAALVVAAGLVPGRDRLCAVLAAAPYMAGLLAAVYAVYLLVRLTAAGEPLRAYIHEQTVLKLPGSCTLAAVLAGITAAAQLVQLAVSRQNLPRVSCLSCCRQQQPGAFAMENHQFKALKYEKQE